MISTKGRYGLRVLLDIAQNGGDGFVSLKAISERQEISMKYLEMIMSAMNKAGLVKSQRGKDGGYKLTKPPKEYSLAEILCAAEGGISAVECHECGDDSSCTRAEICLTFPIWQKLEGVINDYLESISLADILERKVKE